MGADFSVDLPALDSAARGLTAVLEEVRAHPVRDIDCQLAAFGHDRLARTVRDFCDRWQIGVQHLTDDGAQIAEHLTATSRTYHQAEQAATGALIDAVTGLDQLDGPPGAHATASTTRPGAPGLEAL
jgi:hypothetical protein